MPLQLVRQRLRLRADERSRQPLLDQYTNATPKGWVRAATQFEVALASGGLVDMGNLSSVTLEASPYNDRSGPRAFSKTLPGGTLDNTLVEATWTDGTRQHAVFAFSGTEMNLPLQGAPRADYWLVVSALTASGDALVCGAGRLTMAEDGAFATDTAAAAPNPPVLLTMAQADARYVRPAGALNLAPGVTATTGGGPTCLDGLPTSALPSYYGVLVREASLGLTAWLLEPDAADATGARSVVPLDHDPANNARTWRQRL